MSYTVQMFTGIISDVAAVLKHSSVADGITMSFERPAGWTDLSLGESIATDGACLTVSALRDDGYDCFLMSETLRKTTFGTAMPKRVNLERAMRAGDRFGGHIVQGHVDEVGTVVGIDESAGWVMRVRFGHEQAGLVMYKGSICINGVSLTVTQVRDDELSVALIPHTLEHTTLGDLKAGDRVNLEFDTVGKYIANIMEARHAKS